jgi:hypothetical protein
MAPRSWQVMLSCLSSLTDHSDFPTPITRILPVSPNLMRAYRRRSPAETPGSEVLPPLSITTCHQPYSGLRQVLMPFTSLTAIAFSLKIEDRRVSPLLRSLSLYRTLPAMTVRPHLTNLHRSLNATACGFGKHPWLGKTRTH